MRHAFEAAVWIAILLLVAFVLYVSVHYPITKLP
jgi:hypothetical protein